MAERITNEALKQEALRTLQQGREEITAEAALLRLQLSPKRVAATVFRRHTTGVMVSAATAGLGLALLLFPRRRPAPVASAAQAAAAKVAKEEKKKKKPRGGKLKTLIEFAAPLLLRKVVTPYVTSWLDKQTQGPSSEAPRTEPDQRQRQGYDQAPWTQP